MTAKKAPVQDAAPQETPAAESVNATDAALVSDGFGSMNVEADVEGEPEAPPPYGALPDQLQFSQAGFEAGAAVTTDGRVNININQKNRRLADLLAPTLRNQLRSSDRPEPVLPPAYIPPSLGGQPGQVPPPRLNVVIQIVGSRGDVQPFVALGKVLRETYHHRVRIATHPTFQSFVEENGLEFFSIGGDPAELMAFMVKNPGLMPGIDALKSGEITKRRKGMEEILKGCWRSCIEPGDGLGPAPIERDQSEPLGFEQSMLPMGRGPKPFIADAIIANPPSFAHIHVAERLGIPLHMMFTMPWSPTRAFPHPLANIQSSNTDTVMTNYVSYALVEMMTWQGLGDVINRFRERTLDLEPLPLIWAPGLLTRLQIPYTYCWSPALIPKPNDWSRNIDISGFFFLNLASSYTPEPDLAAFLESGPPPIYIGFGSIVVDDPNALTRLIFDAVHLTGVRALVSKGWGGLGADSVGVPEGVFMLGNVPHDWLFKHVSAVCHHGGAGTTAAGIQAGKPTIVVPFFGDQPFWGAMVQKAGAGPAPIHNKKLNAENLAEAIKFCMKPDTQERAKELGESIREEKGTDVGGRSFHDHLEVDSLRCSIAPNRVAVWRVRRTQVRLSGFAAAVLVKEGVIKWTDLKLYRSKDHNTDSQPWDPISAVTASLVMDISGITMAIADFPRDIFKAVSKKDGERSKTPTPPGGSEQASVSAGDQKSVGTPSITSPSVSSLNVGELPGSSDRRPTTPSLSVRSPDQSSIRPSTASTEATSHATTSQSHAPPVPPRSDSGVAGGVNLEQALEAGKGVSRIVTTGVRSPMNFCLGLARGFRNAPKLYNDETVRPTEKVTDLASGFKVAGREFGFGFYDGLTGLVTHPLKGAEKEGTAGLIKGLGKGVGGLILKPAAAFWSIPAYTMQGLNAQLKNAFGKGAQNQIAQSRIVEGMVQLEEASPQERADILLRWNAVKYDLKNFYSLKVKEAREEEKEREKSGSPDRTGASASGSAADASLSPPKTGWFNTRHLSFEERKKLHSKKDAWKKSHIETTIPTTDEAGHNHDLDSEFEKAIRASVKETSRGNPEEDAAIEQAMRASLQHMQNSGNPLPGDNPPPSQGTEAEPHGFEITDEEYQELIEKAIQQSMALQAAGQHPDHAAESDDEDYRKAIEESKRPHASGAGDDDEALRKAIRESEAQRAQAGTHEGGDEDEELRKALEASKSAHADKLQRENSAKAEEDIVLEYVKKQSLAEEELRRQKAKGKDRGDESKDGNEDDEDLKRALEESMKLGRSDGAGPSGGPSA